MIYRKRYNVNKTDFKDLIEEIYMDLYCETNLFVPDENQNHNENL